MDDSQRNNDGFRYIPSPRPDTSDPEVLANWALQELEQISTVIANISAGHCDYLNGPPEKPRNGMIRFADGTNWNPGGTGRGYYGFDESTGGWRKLG